MTVEAMAIANDEEVEPLLPAHVWNQRISILVYLVRVSRLMSTRSSECKLRDCVEPLSDVLLLALLYFGCLAYVVRVFLCVNSY
jgi:hypothetical protein